MFRWMFSYKTSTRTKSLYLILQLKVNTQNILNYVQKYIIIYIFILPTIILKILHNMVHNI